MLIKKHGEQTNPSQWRLCIYTCLKLLDNIITIVTMTTLKRIQTIARRSLAHTAPVLRKAWRKWPQKKWTITFLICWILFILSSKKPDPVGRLSYVTARVVHLDSAEIRIMEGGDIRLHIRNQNKTLLKVNIGYFLPYAPSEIFTLGKSILFVWKDGLELELSSKDVQKNVPNFKKFTVSWKVKNPKHAMLKDVVSLDSHHWFGGTHISRLTWPVETWETGLLPYITADPIHQHFGNIQERYWLSSAGIVLTVDNYNPLFVQFKEKSMTLVSKWEHPYRRNGKEPLQLSYSIYQARDIMTVHKLTSRLLFRKPRVIPDELMYRHPIWSTWIVYKWFVTQERVIRYAKDIHDHGFNASQVELDDDWTTAYGDLVFDWLKFPDPAGMVRTIKQYGFRMSLWVPPFCSLKSESSSLSNIWVRGSWMSIVPWWDAYGYLMDVTSPHTVKWLKKALHPLRTKYNITTFKFDAGEAIYLPRNYKTHRNLKSPNDYTKFYGEVVARLDGNVRGIEIRTATGMQHLPVFFRFMDKNSRWDFDNGLKTIIPHAIQMGLLGYFSFIPDIIGGNQYDFYVIDKEIFIRWVQVTVFMPVMQFSKPPWHFDEETLQITREMTRLHYKYSNYIIQLAKEAILTGDPIIRPLWWYWPDDETALTIHSEFLLGDKLLVAPVLEQGARTRDIYFPSGKWYHKGKVYAGPSWSNDFPAPLSELVYFTKVHQSLESNTAPYSL